jgi:hypothetical protein
VINNPELSFDPIYEFQLFARMPYVPVGRSGSAYD